MSETRTSTLAMKRSRRTIYAALATAAEDADLYVDAREGYPIAFERSYSGEYPPLAFEGDFDVRIELTGINANPPVSLPSACNRPIYQ